MESGKAIGYFALSCLSRTEHRGFFPAFKTQTPTFETEILNSAHEVCTISSAAELPYPSTPIMDFVCHAEHLVRSEQYGITASDGA